jgi:peptide-methionine (S)-S-oxide reductase
MKLEIATFGMGCFWGAQAVMAKIEGVVNTEVGFMRGESNEKQNQKEVNPKSIHIQEAPTYEEVSRGTTKYIEVVQVAFDSTKVSYFTLVTLFWRNHNPTTLKSQGPNVGPQYRSAIFYHTIYQLDVARESYNAIQKQTAKELITKVDKASQFYKADETHQHYFKKMGINMGGILSV